MAALGTDGVLGNPRGPRAGWWGGREHPDGLQSPGRPSRKPGRRGAAHGKDGDRPRGARTPERTAPQGREARGGGAKPARTAGTGPSALVTRAKAGPAARWTVDGGRGALLARGAAHAATPASLGDVPSLAGQFCG